MPSLSRSVSPEPSLGPRVGPRVRADDPDEVVFRALATTDDPAERAYLQDLIANRYTGLVRWVAGRYTGRAVDTDELHAVGFFGLALAIDRFDPAHGSAFIAYARPTIQGEIRRYFRDKRRWIRLPRRLQETKALLIGATDDLTHELGRAPTVDEIAAYLQVDAEDVLEALTVDDNFTVASLDAPASLDGDGGQTLADTVGFDESRFALIEDCETLRPLIAALPARDQQILQLRFFEDLTQSEIGVVLGISQMHVSRLLTRTLVTLRKQMLADG